MDGRPAAVFVVAHPDDVAFSMGGAAWLLKDTHRLHVVCATRGERGYAWTGPGLAPPNPAVAQVREAEERAACALIGASLEFLDLEDGMICAGKAAVERVAAILVGRRPQLVFSHGPQDKPDHAVMSILALQALHLAGLFWETDLCLACEHASRQMRSPDLFLDITSAVAGKRAQIACHASHHHDPGSIDALLSVNADLGRIAGCAAAEAYLVSLPVMGRRWGRSAAPQLLRPA
jgi:LmbE family N-acetylglucosaminyl deacetylase